MQTLTLSRDSFDKDNTFMVEVTGYRRTKQFPASLKRGYNHDDDTYWALKKSAVLKDRYTDADHAEQHRLNDMTPIRHGDIVIIEGEQYRANVLGDFMDCIVFKKI